MEGNVSWTPHSLLNVLISLPIKNWTSKIHLTGSIPVTKHHSSMKLHALISTYAPVKYNRHLCWIGDFISEPCIFLVWQYNDTLPRSRRIATKDPRWPSERVRSIDRPSRASACDAYFTAVMVKISKSVVCPFKLRSDGAHHSSNPVICVYSFTLLRDHARPERQVETGNWGCE